MPSILLKGARVIDPSQNLDCRYDVLIENDKISVLSKRIDRSLADKVIDLDGLVLSPGFIDLHAHLRDPGQTQKEDIESGSNAAVAGGITSVCCMANTQPVNDNAVVTRYIVEKAKAVGLCNVFPVGAITKGLNGEEISNIGSMVKAGIVAISDDGNPTKSSRVLRNGMLYAKDFGIPVFTHSEDRTLSENGQMNEGFLSSQLGIPGMPSEAEEIGTFRDIAIAKLTGAHVHICHVSTAYNLKIIEAAKESGIDVTCEITPHHFSLTEETVRGFNTNAKVSPPLRTRKDVEACRNALKRDIADAIATDHAPHTEDEKMVEFCKAPFGMIGFQTLLPLSLNLVREGYLSLPQMIRKLSTNPARIIGKRKIGTLMPGSKADITVFDPNEEYILKREMIHSKSFNTPFLGKKMKGKVKFTVHNGKITYKD